MQNLRNYRDITPKLGADVYIDETACVIGRVILANDVSIWPMAVLRGDVNHIHIGARSNVQDGSVLHVTRVSEANPAGYPLIIGSDVTIGHKAMLHGCQIGDRVLIGMGAIVLDGAVIENEVMVAAGSVVPPKKQLLSGYLYLGNPVRQARPLTDEEVAYFRKSATNYVALKNDYLTSA
jgi:Carbonic anhydrases/acetyltransferases, isoleucine patch superfamily